MSDEIDLLVAQVKGHTDALNAALQDACDRGLVVNTDVLEIPIFQHGITRKFVTVELLQPLLRAGAK